MQTANKSCRHLVESRTPFKAHNLFAEMANGFYVVYSYGHHWPLWAFDGQTWYENIERYSVTTSRQKSQTRPSILTFKLSCLGMRDLITRGVAVTA